MYVHGHATYVANNKKNGCGCDWGIPLMATAVRE